MNKIRIRFIAFCLLFTLLGTLDIPAFAEGTLQLQIMSSEGDILEDISEDSFSEESVPNGETAEIERPEEPSFIPEEEQPQATPMLPEAAEPTNIPEPETSIVPEPKATPEPAAVQSEISSVLVQYIDPQGERLIGEVTTLNDSVDKIKIEDGVLLEDYMEQSLQQNANIKWIQPDYIAQLASVSENWCFSNTDSKNTLKIPLEEYQTSQISKQMLTQQYAVCSNFPVAMQESTGNGVSVGIIDNAADESTVENWHGRMIHNILEQIVPDARLVDFAVFKNGKAATSEIIQAIEQCKQDGIQIVNCSWTIEAECPVLEEVIQSSNMLFICAAGNNRSNLDDMQISPASIKADNVITVAAANQDGQLSSFSNYSNRKVDIAAQGNRITAAISETENYTSDGTSFAAAFVAGAAALVAGYYPEDVPEQTKQRILNSAVSLSELQKGVTQGRFLDCTYLLEDGYINRDIILFRANQIPVKQGVFDLQANSISDSQNNSWEEYGTMQTVRRSFASISYDGSIYLLGGQEQGENEESALVERYTASDGTWQTLSSMPHPRQDPQAAELDGKIYIFGGTMNGIWSRKIDVYDIASDTWSSLEDFPFDNEFYTIAEERENHRIYVLGGKTTAVYCLNPQTMQWEQMRSLMQSMSYPKATYMGNGSRICVTEGSTGNCIIYDQGEQEMDYIYNLENYAITSVPDSTAEQDWKMFITGGNLCGAPSVGVMNPSNKVQVRYEEDNFDGGRLQWFGAQALPIAVTRHGMGQDGQYLYVLGGTMEKGEYNTHIYRLRTDAKIDDNGYTVTTNEWGHGTVNYMGDRDTYTFVPSVTGLYTIDIETENRLLLRSYGQDGSGGDLLEHYIDVLNAGEAYSFTIEGDYEDGDVGRYSFRFRLLESDLNKIVELPLNEMVAVTKPRDGTQSQWFAVPGSDTLYLGTDQEVFLETYMFRRNKQWLDKGLHQISMNNIYKYICIGSDSGWTEGQSYAIGVFDRTHKPGNYETLSTARNKAKSVTDGTDLYLIGGYQNGVVRTIEKRVEGQWQEITEMRKNILGFGTAILDGKIYVAGGNWTGAYVSDLEIYDIQSGKWTSGAAMPEARERMSLCAADGTLYAVGGRNLKGECTSVLAYNVASNTWSNVGELPQGLLEPGAEVIDNILYLFGGFNESGEWTTDMYQTELPSIDWELMECPLTQGQGKNTVLCKEGTKLHIVKAAYGVLSIYYYDTLSKQWSQEANAYLFEDVKYPAVNILDGTLYFMGGYTDEYGGKAVKVDLNTASFHTDWHFFSEMLDGKNKTEAFWIEDELYTMGGFSNGKANTQIDKYNSASKSWEEVSGMPYFYPSSGFCTVSQAHKIYMIGGQRSEKSLQQFWEYDLDLEKWTEKRSMIAARDRAGAVVDEASGMIYVFGGRGNYGMSDTIEQYNIKTDTWREIGIMPEARTNFGISRVGEQVLIVGGYNEAGENVTTSMLYDISTGKWSEPQEVPGLTEDDYVIGVKGVPNGVFAFKRVGSPSMRVAEYDFDKEQWMDCELNQNIPEGDYFSFAADEENVYYLGGYSQHKKENSNAVYSYPYQVRKQEPSGIHKNIYVEQGKEYQIAFSVQAMEEMGSQECVLQYDSAFCEILDLNSQTPEKDLNIGTIQGSSLVITSFENGRVMFRVNKPVFEGKIYSGLVNTISFKAKQTGKCVIKGKVRRAS